MDIDQRYDLIDILVLIKVMHLRNFLRKFSEGEFSFYISVFMSICLHHIDLSRDSMTRT